MTARASGGPVGGAPYIAPAGTVFTASPAVRLLAENAALLEQVQHLEAAVEHAARYKRIGMEVQKRVNRGEVEGSYLDLRGVKIPRTEART